MTNPVIHFEIGARDSATLREFYQRMFGWKFDSSDPNYSLVASTNGGIGGGTVVAPTPIPGVGEFAMLRDPEGHAIGLLHTGAPEGKSS